MFYGKMAVEKLGWMATGKTALQKDSVELALCKSFRCVTPHLSVARSLGNAIRLDIAKEEDVFIMSFVCDEEGG